PRQRLGRRLTPLVIAAELSHGFDPATAGMWLVEGVLRYLECTLAACSRNTGSEGQAEAVVHLVADAYRLLRAIHLGKSDGVVDQRPVLRTICRSCRQRFLPRGVHE